MQQQRQAPSWWSWCSAFGCVGWRARSKHPVHRGSAGTTRGRRGVPIPHRLAVTSRREMWQAAVLLRLQNWKIFRGCFCPCFPLKPQYCPFTVLRLNPLPLPG